MIRSPGFLALALLLSGCGASMPQWVKDRPAYVDFNPAGSWQATGQTIHSKDAKVPLTLTLADGRKTFDIAIPSDDSLRGHALVDGDWVYTMTTSDLPATALFVYTVGADQMDGLRATKVLGYVHAVRKDKAPGDPVAGNWDTEGAKEDGGHYTGQMIIAKVGDHYSITSKTGKSSYDGVAFLLGDKLIASVVTTESVKVRKRLVSTDLQGGLGVETTTKTRGHIASYVVGAYQRQGNVLRGSTLYGSNEEGEANREEDKLTADEWSRADAPAPHSSL